MPELRAADFDVLSFDCYGTLVDWQSAITQYLQGVLLNHDVHVFDETILDFFAEWEPREQNAGGLYSDVLKRMMDRYGSRLGFTPNIREKDRFVNAVASAQPFSDTLEALPGLADSFRLAIISNTDKAIIDSTLQSLPVVFAPVLTSEELGAYKPDQAMLAQAFERLGTDRARVLHVAESLVYDINPAKELRVRTVWINRQTGQHSATKGVSIEPSWTFTDLVSFADAIRSNSDTVRSTNS